MISVSLFRLAVCALERVEIDVDDVDGSARLAATVCDGHHPTTEVYRGHVFHVHWKMDRKAGTAAFSFGFRLRFSYHEVCVCIVCFVLLFDFLIFLFFLNCIVTINVGRISAVLPGQRFVSTAVSLLTPVAHRTSVFRLTGSTRH